MKIFDRPLFLFLITALILGVLIIFSSMIFFNPGLSLGALSFLSFGLAAGNYLGWKTSQGNREFYRAVFEQSNDAMFVIGEDTRIFKVNQTGRILLGLPKGQTQAVFLKSLADFQPVLNAELFYRSSKGNAPCECCCKRRDGLMLELELSASLITQTTPPLFGLTLRNAGVRKEAENALKLSEERYRLAIDGSNAGLWDWNLKNGEIFYSTQWKAMLGFQESEIKPTLEEWFARVHPSDMEPLNNQLAWYLSGETQDFECEYRLASKTGQFYWMLARGRILRDTCGYAERIVGTQIDMTPSKLLEEQLRHEALHDGLTGAANRTLLLEKLKHLNERKKRAPNLLFAVFFLDLDRFKRVNDRLGHLAGDQLLIEAAKRLENGLRPVDTVSRLTGPGILSRLAGDEFVILLEDSRSVDYIHKVGERIATLIDHPFRIDGKEVKISASIGLVVPEQPYEQVEDLIRDADIAMYHAKQLGGGRVVRFQPKMSLLSLKQMRMLEKLR